MNKSLLIRPYELLLYNLQDEFIAALKTAKIDSNVSAKDSVMTLKDDGTEQLKFTLPLYYRENGEIKENPIGKYLNKDFSIQGLYKVKVVFLKEDNTKDHIFEFVITEVTLKHTEGMVSYEITAEGLAFNELGKTGYKISFSHDSYQLDYEKSYEENPENFIKANIQYWADQVIDGTDWKYEVHFQGGSIVYEDAYTSDWKIENDRLVPARIENKKEKERIVEAKESNRYNLTQTIAETFGLKCRYEYVHDFSNHIIEKKIIFYDAILREEDGKIDLNYKYDSSEITRSLDSSEIVTKLFIPPVDDNTITTVEANKTGEDYIYNFDYLELINDIKPELLEELKKHEVSLAEANKEIIEKQKKISVYQLELNNTKAKKTIAHNAFLAASENVERLDQELNALLGPSKGITYSGKDSNSYYSTLLSNTSKPGEKEFIIIPFEGVSVINNFAMYDNNKGTPSSPEFQNFTNLNNYSVEVIENGKKTKIIFNDRLKSPDGSEITSTTRIYLTFTYSPFDYKTNLRESYSVEAAQRLAEEESYNALIEDYQTILESTEEELSTLITDKKAKIDFFENMFGPAIREGSWTPSDYQNFGSKKTLEIPFFSKQLSNYDDEPFEGEELSYYEEGVGSSIQKKYYQIFNFEDTFRQLQEDEKIDIIDNLDRLYVSMGQYWKKISRGEWSNFTQYKKDDLVYVRTESSNLLYIALAPSLGQSPLLETSEELWSTVGYDQALSSVSEYNNEKTYELHSIVKIDSDFYISTVDEEISGKSPLEYGKQKTYYYGSTLKPIIFQDQDSIKFGFKIEDKILTAESFIAIEFGYLRPSDDNDFVENERIKMSRSPILEEGDSNIKYLYARAKLDPSLMVNDDYMRLSLIDNGIILDTLEKFKDYNILYRLPSLNNLQFQDGFFLTVKPQVLIRNLSAGDQAVFSFLYQTANAAEQIYLDGLIVSKENAFPKASYTVNVNNINTNLSKNLYKMLDVICGINDYKLHFNNVLGYISEIQLNLDDCSKDSLTITNYKTKFEDLFSSIVAATETIKQNAVEFSHASGGFTADGLINSNVLQASIAKGEPVLSFNNGSLIISEDEGIVASSKDGAISIRGDGFFIADSQDREGKYQWKQAANGNGFNADVITAGTLNTKLLKIFAEDDVAFQMDADGLYAYYQDGEGIHDNEYVVHNGDGLFLTQYNNEIGEPVDRVEISWQGLKLRNKSNQEVFFADDDTGNLTLTGAINAQTGGIGPWKIDDDSIYQYLDEEGAEPSDFFFHKDTFYFGKKGMSFNDVFKLEISNPENQRALFEELAIMQKNPDAEEGEENEYVFRVFKSENDETYNVYIKNLEFDSNFQLPVENGGTGGSSLPEQIKKIKMPPSSEPNFEQIVRQNLSELNPKNGTLALLYDDEESQEQPSASIYSKYDQDVAKTLFNSDPSKGDIRCHYYSSEDFYRPARGIFEGIQALRWNTSYSTDQNLITNAQLKQDGVLLSETTYSDDDKKICRWGRVGVAQTSSNTCALMAELQTCDSFGQIGTDYSNLESVELEFQYCNRIYKASSSSSWDQISASSARTQTINVALFRKSGDSIIKVNETTFLNEGTETVGDVFKGKVTFSLADDENKLHGDSIYLIVFYSPVVRSLIYVNQESIKFIGSAEPSYSTSRASTLFVYSSNCWQKLAAGVPIDQNGVSLLLDEEDDLII